MSPLKSTITVKVTDKAGGTRFFQFEAGEVRIGFRLGADISLDPPEADGGEIRVFVDGDVCVVEPVARPDSFILGRKPIGGRMKLKKGDIISAGAYRLQVEELIVAEAPVDPGDDDKTVSERSGKRSDSRSRVVQQASESYLVLFFEPVREYLEDDDVSEIMINGPERIYVERKGKVRKTDAKFINEQALQAAVKNVARNMGRIFNSDNPRLDARLPDGSRVHAVMPPLSRAGTTVAIRKFSKEKLTMGQLIKYGSISEAGAGLIDAIVSLHKNVIISGPTSSGKTSVLNVLSSFIGKDERILVIEDASELQLQQEHTVYFETRKPDEHGKGEVTIRDLVASSLRLRPDRLIVGEIRGGESLDMLQAMNTGHSGSMSTIHANGPVEALSRIETCALLSGIEIPLSAIRRQVASAINVVVHTARLPDGSRKITNIAEVLELKDGEYAAQDLIHFRAEGLDSDGKLIGSHVGTGVRPRFFDEAKLRGIAMDAAWFEAPKE